MDSAWFARRLRLKREARIQQNPNPLATETNLKPLTSLLPLSGDGSFDDLLDGIGFYSVTATYHDAVLGKEIGNIRVEGIFRDPSAVPEPGASLPLLGLCIGFFYRRRR